ncbi:MAG: GtrA family protein [Nitrospiraceae bacterium]
MTYPLSLQPPITKLFHFAAMGLVATAIHFAVLITLVQISGMAPVSASTLGFITGAAVNYLLNYHFTFKSRKPHTEAAAKFLIVALCGLTLNSSLMYIGTEVLSVQYLISQAAATILVLLWNFTANYLWSFRVHGDGR